MANTTTIVLPITAYVNMERNVKLLTWDNINVVTKKGKNIINNISGYAKHDETLAIMGPSGCGKTTLLNCLAQRRTASFTGDVKVDNTKITASAAKELTAYVQQEDALIPYRCLDCQGNDNVFC